MGKRGTRPGTHHLDRRARQLAETGAGDDDELLTSQQLADWWGVSIQWVEIGRVKAYGSPFVKIGNLIRYRRGTARQYLLERQHRSTAEYRESASA